jgi:hypothetical protein
MAVMYCAAADAPINDLNLYKAIKQYSEINDSVATDGLKKAEISNLWYLGPEIDSIVFVLIQGRQ